MTTGRTFIENLDPTLRDALSQPALSLMANGWILDQENDREERFDPHRITYELQQTIVSYVNNPPRNETGHTLWLNLIGPRQSGKSTCAEAAFYPKAAYNPGWKHVCSADVKWRADALHDRTQFMHKRWPEAIRAPTHKGEVRQITFEHDSSMTVLSGGSDGLGVGMSFTSFHGSELPLWKDASKEYSQMNPAMINKKNALMLNESTPFPLSEPSARWWKDKYESAKMRRGRDIAAFFPFWDLKLAARPWPIDQNIDEEEKRLLERYGKHGLTLGNLAFRRLMLETDPEIRRNHDLFGVYYPFDDLTCWIEVGKAAIPHRVIHRHTDKEKLRPWGASDTYIAYIEEPNPDATYVIGCDPAGYAGRDHCSFQVLEVWADEWRQAASFATVTDPEAMTKKLMEVGYHYNKALIGVERNQGGGPLALLRTANYPNLFYDHSHQPGVWKSDEQEFVSLLVDALLDKLTLYDEDLVSQLLGYQQDRVTQLSLKSELLAPGKNRGRRDRHHWDKVSALMIACTLAPYAPTRYKRIEKPANVRMLGSMTWDEMVAYDKLLAQHRESGQNGRRTRYTRTRRR